MKAAARPAWHVGGPDEDQFTVIDVEANLAGLDVSLTGDQLGRLDKVSAPTLNYPAPMRHRGRLRLP